MVGDTFQFEGNGKNYCVVNVVGNKLRDSLALIIDDGIDEMFIAGNRRLHQKLMGLKIPHEYIKRPGKHSCDHWRYAVHFQLLFFSKFFDAHQGN